MNWIIGVALLVAIGYLLDREIYFYEGVHLGPRLQAWLYNRWSRKYDEGKRASQLHDDEMLAHPLLDALRHVPEPFVLDFATGTGRLSYVLLKREEFQGHIVALDLSQGMLEQAAAKLGGLDTSEKNVRSTRPAGASSAGQASTAPSLTTVPSPPPARASAASVGSVRVQFLRHLSLPLPFPDAAFDAVCALEVLELFPNMDEPLSELTRVLRPGGVLLTSRGTEESGRRAKVKRVPEITSLLQRHEMEQIQITNWWKLFDRVMAVKNGSSQPVERKDLAQILKCSSCSSINWVEASDRWKCRDCGNILSLTKEGIVLN